MSNIRLASRYAKSLMDLSVEQNNIEKIFADTKYLQALCTQSKDFSNMLKSPIIAADKKKNIVEAILKGNVDNLTQSFVVLLINKGRESDLQTIAAAYQEQYNEKKGINKIKLTTAVAVSDEVKNNIVGKIKQAQGFGNIELETVVNENIIGGFVAEFNNNLLDASVSSELKNIKKNFASNTYIPTLH